MAKAQPITVPIVLKVEADLQGLEDLGIIARVAAIERQLQELGGQLQELAGHVERLAYRTPETGPR